MRHCETLHYHCSQPKVYPRIKFVSKSFIPRRKVEVDYQKTNLNRHIYKSGFIFLNKKLK